jgi:hypothetical protein
MWALCGLWRKRIREGVGEILKHLILLELEVGMKASFGEGCVILLGRIK